MSATVKNKNSIGGDNQEAGLGLQLSGASLELKAAPVGKPPRQTGANHESKGAEGHTSAKDTGTLPNGDAGPSLAASRPSLNGSTGQAKQVAAGTTIAAKQHSRVNTTNMNEEPTH